MNEFIDAEQVATSRAVVTDNIDYAAFLMNDGHVAVTCGNSMIYSLVRDLDARLLQRLLGKWNPNASVYEAAEEVDALFAWLGENV